MNKIVYRLMNIIVVVALALGRYSSVSAGTTMVTTFKDIRVDNTIQAVKNADNHEYFAESNLPLETTSYTFADVPGTHWAWDFIERLHSAGITGGCSATPLMYCPLAPVTRAQMAIFILRGIHGSAYTPPAATGNVFSDVSINTFGAAWIEQFALEGVTSGCGSGLYCPDANVTRAQMAIFLLKGKHGPFYIPPVATGVFPDVPVGSFAADWIEQLAAEGVTGGCGDGLYCPNSNVTRDQMAVFLVRMFLISRDIYYVSLNGSDTNPGTQAQPWKTIQNAANTATSGNTVIVLAGNYAERVTINTSGVNGGTITFQAQGTVVMRGFTVLANYITIRGFEITDTADNSTSGWGVYVRASNCVIENNYIHYATRGGILLDVVPGSEALTANCIVRNNRLYRNSQVGINVRGRNHLIENNEIWETIQYHPKWINPPSWVDADGIRFFGSGHIFRGNYIHDISAYAPPENINPHVDAFQTWDEDILKAGNNSIFENNQIVLGNGGATGFQLEGGTHDLIIRNNIVQAFAGIRSYKNKRSPYTSPSNLFVLNNLFIGDLTYINWPVGVTIQDATNVVVNNNIFYNQADYTIDIANSTGVAANYNLAYNSDGSIPRSPIGTPILDNLWDVNPLFVNPGIGDYHLQAGSPAIDVGISSSYVTNDYDGNVRPQGTGYDIGPYEYK